ncbi:hypothetical protein KI387_015303, partial [Taxus chinensis]
LKILILKGLPVVVIAKMVCVCIKFRYLASNDELWKQKYLDGEEEGFSVDGSLVRVFRNNQELGVPYPKKQPMRIYSSLWNAEDWATRGGLIKTDWTKVPFLTSFRNFNFKPDIVEEEA